MQIVTHKIEIMAFVYRAHFLKLLFLLMLTRALESVAHRGT